MKLIARFTVLVLVVALSLAYSPRSGNAGAAATSKSSNCYFVRNHLPCPCPSGQKTRALVRAARVTAGALGNAFGTTAAAVTRTERTRPPVR